VQVRLRTACAPAYQHSSHPSHHSVFFNMFLHRPFQTLRAPLEVDVPASIFQGRAPQSLSESTSLVS
jgi:hypothetical protein